MQLFSKYIIALLIVISAMNVYSQKSGEQIFLTVCSACHSIGKGKIIGPDLDGVNARYDAKWLTSFIRSSQTMVKNGDARAVKVFKAYDQIPMPDQNLTDPEIKLVLTYIKTRSSVKPVNPVNTRQAPAPDQPSSTGQMKNTKTSAVKEPWVDAEIKINAIKVSEPVDPKQMDAAFWNNITSSFITLVPQKAAYPHLPEASVTRAEVKSVHYNNLLAFRVSWTDSTRDVFVESDMFCDQLAIQLPVDPGVVPSYMMGNKGGKVHIIHWKGIWQEDCENGFRDVQKAYPNMWVDSYPYQEGVLDRSRRVFANEITAEHIVESQNTLSMPATYAKNPMSSIKRKEPVEEAGAVGFGTLATQQTQNAKAWAKWENNTWTVIIVVPVNTGAEFNAKVTSITKIAFAIWDGNYQEIGGRKNHSIWADLILK